MKSRLFVLCCCATLALHSARGEFHPLLNTHSHNDYEQARPLAEALDQGFCSVEADIFLVGDQLQVAHDRTGLRKERTLQSLYLDPLRKRIREQGGIYPGHPFFHFADRCQNRSRADLLGVGKSFGRI